MSQRSAARALAELRTIRSSDPAASSAMRAIKLTELTLANWWLPSDEMCLTHLVR